MAVDPANTVRVGVLGCGAVAAGIHLPNLRRLPGVQVVALADADDSRLRLASAQFPAAQTDSEWERLLETSSLDAVLVCLPTGLHARAAQAAFDRGRHVYLEKPLATTVAEARPVIEAWKRSGRVGMIGFNMRFHPLHRALRATIASGQIGAVTGCRSIFSAGLRNVPLWKRSIATGGGALLDLASHHVDLIHFLLGQTVAEVSALIADQHTEGDTAALSFRLGDGRLAQCFVTLGSGEEDRFEVLGEEGRAVVHRFLSLTVEVYGRAVAQARSDRMRNALRSAASLPYLLRKLRSPGHDPSYGFALSAFLNAVRGTGPDHPDLEDGLRSLAVIDAAVSAASAGRVAPVDFRNGRT